MPFITYLEFGVINNLGTRQTYEQATSPALCYGLSVDITALIAAKLRNIIET
jgi:hypothetical protein